MACHWTRLPRSRAYPIRAQNDRSMARWEYTKSRAVYLRPLYIVHLGNDDGNATLYRRHHCRPCRITPAIRDRQQEAVWVRRSSVLSDGLQQYQYPFRKIKYHTVGDGLHRYQRKSWAETILHHKTWRTLRVGWREDVETSHRSRSTCMDRHRNGTNIIVSSKLRATR